MVRTEVHHYYVRQIHLRYPVDVDAAEHYRGGPVVPDDAVGQPARGFEQQPDGVHLLDGLVVALHVLPPSLVSDQVGHVRLGAVHQGIRREELVLPLYVQIYGDLLVGIREADTEQRILAGALRIVARCDALHADVRFRRDLGKVTADLVRIHILVFIHVPVQDVRQHVGPADEFLEVPVQLLPVLFDYPFAAFGHVLFPAFLCAVRSRNAGI